MIEITGLTVYPVKGLAGIGLSQATLKQTGLAYDRHWMVVMPNGRMVTQRQMPPMAVIKTAVCGDKLVLSAAGISDLEVPLETDAEADTDVSVWRDSFPASAEGEDASSWLTQVLASKFPLRLVRMAKNVTRPQSEPDLMGAETHTHFADAAPYLVANESSLAAVNRQLAEKGGQPVPMNRFRPNIVTRGLDAFAEYESASLAHAQGQYALQLCYPCERCVVTTIDQQTGVMDKTTQEPLATLNEMQTAAGYKGAYFAENARLVSGEGHTIRVGDSLCLDK